MELINKYICCKCWKVLHMDSNDMLTDGSGHLEYSVLFEEFRWRYYCDSCDRKYYPDYHNLPVRKEERKF